MADYNDYLIYLKHVDDTTKQDFKARENVLIKEMSDLKAQFNEEKTQIKNYYDNNISDLKTQFKIKEDAQKKEISDLHVNKNKEISKLKEAQQSEISKHKKILGNKIKEISDKENIINDLQSKLDNANYEIECWRSSNQQIQEQRNQLMYIRIALMCIGLFFSIFPCYGVPIVIYFSYVVYKVTNKEKYISVLRWARCDKNTNAFANKMSELFTK